MVRRGEAGTHSAESSIPAAATASPVRAPVQSPKVPPAIPPRGSTLQMRNRTMAFIRAIIFGGYSCCRKLFCATL